MKKYILTIMLFSLGFAGYAQVGIGTANPQTTLHVVGNAGDTPGALNAIDGITVPVVTDDMTTTATNGTKISQLVYSTNASSTGYYHWNGSSWMPLNTMLNATIENIDCSSACSATNNSANFYFLSNTPFPAGTSLTLPAASTRTGDIIVISNIDGAGGDISFTNTLIGSESLLPPNSTYSLVSNGSNWIIIK